MILLRFSKKFSPTRLREGELEGEGFGKEQALAQASLPPLSPLPQAGGGKLLWLMAVFMVWSFPAFADKPATDPCASNAEVISSLAGPIFSYPLVWDAQYFRPDRQIQLFASMPLDETHVLSVGRAFDIKTFKPVETVIVVIDHRGRLSLEKSYPMHGWELPVAMVPTRAGFAVLSDIRSKDGSKPQSARLAFYDKQGMLKSEKKFSDPLAGLEAEALTVAPAGRGNKEGGFAIALHAVEPHTGNEYSVIERLSDAGAPVWRREYKPGISNALLDLAPAGDGFIAAGRIREGQDDARSTGWLMRLNGDGSIDWQRPYARGSFAVLTKAIEVPGGFAATGTARPNGGGQASAWIMETDGVGEPKWQRYYSNAGMDFEGAGLLPAANGRLSVMVNASPRSGSKTPAHIRLFALSPMGVLLEDEAYVKGAQARGNAMVTGPEQERVVTASMDSGRDSPFAGRFQGWVFLATAPPAWQDFCLKKAP
jgi:hypothetical protein